MLNGRDMGDRKKQNYYNRYIHKTFKVKGKYSTHTDFKLQGSCAHSWYLYLLSTRHSES